MIIEKYSIWLLSYLALKMSVEKLDLQTGGLCYMLDSVTNGD